MEQTKTGPKPKKLSSKTPKLSSQREQEILDAAVRVFSRKGFNGATTKEIASEAGVAEGTIFRYFKTKKDILLSLVGPYLAQSLTDAIEEVSGATDEVILTAIIKNRLDIIKKNSNLIMLLFTEAQFHPELREKFTEKVVLKVAVVLEQLITTRIKQGAYKEVDPQIATRIFVGMMGIFVLWKTYLSGDKYISFDENTVMKNVVDIFLNGIRESDGGDTKL